MDMTQDTSDKPKAEKNFSMMFPDAGIALDISPEKTNEFFDDFIAMNWGGGSAENFVEKYGEGFRNMTDDEIKYKIKEDAE